MSEDISNFSPRFTCGILDAPTYRVVLKFVDGSEPVRAIPNLGPEQVCRRSELREWKSEKLYEKSDLSLNLSLAQGQTDV